MNRVKAEIEVMHCMKYYLQGIRRTCTKAYYQNTKVEVLEAAREIVDVVNYKVLVNFIEEMEAEENA